MTPHTITLTPEARDRLVAFLQRLEPRMGPGGDLEHIGEWAGKLGGLVVRYAGLFHVWEHTAPRTTEPWNAPLPRATLERAIKLAEDFLVPHALTIFGEMGADPALEQARIVLDTIARWDGQTFSRRDLHQHLRRRFPRPRELDGPLALLAEHGYIRPEVSPEEKRGPGRKPSDRYAINPLWERTRNPPNPQNRTADRDSEDTVNSVYDESNTSEGREVVSGAVTPNGRVFEEVDFG